MTQDFYQDGPRLQDPYENDPLLRGYLRHALPAAVFAEIEPGLKRLGRRVVDEVAPLGLKAESELPRLVPYDPWGRRIDDIHVSDAWKKLDAISAEERLVATGYERRQGEW